MNMSEHPGAEHEPFNWARKQPRQFWPITDAWNTTKDVEALQAALAEVFAQHYLIKHCHELLSTSFNLNLVRAAAKTPYRHVLLLRRDEASRLVSKFIAEAQGTWFREYSRKVFAEIARGERQLETLPVEKIVDHYFHCQSSTRFITDSLSELGIDYHSVYYEDLYTGSRAARLDHLHALFGFLDFTAADIERNNAAIEDKVFHGGQNTRSVAPYAPNLPDVLDALAEAGCHVEPEVFAREAMPARASRMPSGPRERIAREVVQLAQAHGARGPYLEIGGGLFEDAVLLDAHFKDQACHVVGTEAPEESHAADFHADHPNDMRGVFADGAVQTVIWNSVLTHDKFFWRTLDEIKRILTPGGHLIVVAPTFSKVAQQSGIKITGPKGHQIADATITYRVHATPDYWRLSPQALRDVIFGDFDLCETRVNMMPPRVFGLARKPA